MGKPQLAFPIRDALRPELSWTPYPTKWNVVCAKYESTTQCVAFSVMNHPMQFERRCLPNLI